MTQPTSARSQLSFHILLLLGLCGALYFPYIGATPFFDKGEPREALAVQDIVQRGEWLFPLKRAATIPSKPPLFHWSAALTYQVSGRLDEATIRFPSALYATLGVLLVYWLGRKLFGATGALFGGAILATTSLYGNLALNARVDMTLCFFVTASLVLFYSLYRGFLTSPLWYILFYAVVGVGTLAKGPLGMLLPGLVIASFLSVRRRWDLFAKFCFHPGVIVTLVIAVGWYGLAATRGGEGFINRQLMGENLERFFGGSGHSHPIYYYIPYLFAQGLPWSVFLPFVLWDSFKRGLAANEDRLFLWLWFVAMFVFFSVSLGKRQVYVLPLYPALALLLGAWFDQAMTATGTGRIVCRAGSVVAGLTALLIFAVALGALWNHDPGWFLSPLESALHDKDRANLRVVRDALEGLGWTFTGAALLSGVLWFSLAHALWGGQLKLAAHRLVFISILLTFMAHGVVDPVIAESRSYRAFMVEVNRRVQPGDKLYMIGGFNDDPLIFYRGEVIDKLEPSAAALAKFGPGKTYIIMARQSWKKFQRQNPGVPAPILESKGAGPEGDAPLVLVEVKQR